MFRKIISVLLAILLVFTLSSFAGADFGDFGGDSDYDYGGGYDDDYDYDDYDYDDDYDTDYGYSSSYSSSGDDDLDLPDTLIGGVLLLVIVGIYLLSKRKRTKPSGGNNMPAASLPQLLPMSQYTSLDPNFNEAALREKLSNLYVQMQNGWTAKNIEALRPYFTDSLFTQMERQLAQKIQLHQTNYVERISVLGVTLMGYQQRGGEDHIIARLQTRIVDYTLDDKTGALVSGSQTKEKFMTYEWDICRTSGKVTDQMAAMSRTVCPSCGAPLDINSSARCEYCGSVLQRNEHDWAICNIRGISQKTQ